MDRLSCPLCGAEDTKMISTYTSDNYSFESCKKCSGIFANPMRSADKGWYESSEWYLFPAEASEDLKWYERFFLVDYYLYKGKKVLNIGCGRNVFLKKLKESGCSITAIDINDSIIDFTKKVLGIEDAYSCDVFEFIGSYKGEKFDIIIFFEVLEHLERPKEFIANIKNILREDGAIILSVPNRERIMPSNVTWDYPPHHLTRWNTESVRRFFDLSGFSLSRIIISPVSAEGLLSTFNVYFGTKYLEDKINKGNKGIHIASVFKVLFEFRVIFYNILAIILKVFTKNKGVNIYTIARVKN